MNKIFLVEPDVFDSLRDNRRKENHLRVSKIINRNIITYYKSTAGPIQGRSRHGVYIILLERRNVSHYIFSMTKIDELLECYITY